MQPKSKYHPSALTLALILVAIVVSMTSCARLPWSYALPDQSDRVVDTPAIVPTLKITLPSTPTPQRTVPEVTCFTFEQLPAFAFLPDGSGLMVRSISGVQVFDLATGSLQAFLKSSKDLTVAALSPDGRTLAWGLVDNTIQLVRVSDQEILYTLTGDTDWVTKLGFTPDGKYLVSASHDRSVRLWDLSGKELRVIQTDALGIGISPDGRMLATIPFDGPVALWDLVTGEKIKDLGGSGGYDTSDVVFSADGQYLAADLATGLFLWRISDASLVWNGVKNSMAITFSPDGRYLAYSDVDAANNVILADADTAQYIRQLDQMQSPMWDLLFSPDGSLLAIMDGMSIHIRQVSDGALLAVGKSACP